MVVAKVLSKYLQQKVKQEKLQFVIDTSKAVNDSIFDNAVFEEFLRQRFKVKGKAGSLMGLVDFKKDNTKITVDSQIHFSKRYLKYLTKKYLKKTGLRDWIHVVASNKHTYELRYFNINQEA